jgi:hypothetical protein
MRRAIAMQVAERIQVERECERLVTAYCHYVDHGEAASIADLFVDDGVWQSGNVVMEGMDQLREGFGLRQANTTRMSRHVCSNLLLDVLDADNAKGVVYLTLYRHDGEAGRETSPLDGPALVGEYQDRFVRAPEGWRFAHRELLMSFAGNLEGGR